MERVGERSEAVEGPYPRLFEVDNCSGFYWETLVNGVPKYFLKKVGPVRNPAKLSKGVLVVHLNRLYECYPARLRVYAGFF